MESVWKLPFVKGSHFKREPRYGGFPSFMANNAGSVYMSSLLKCSGHGDSDTVAMGGRASPSSKMGRRPYTICQERGQMEDWAHWNDEHLLSLVHISQVNQQFMMTSSNGNIFRVTGPLSGEFTGHRWIPCTKASDAELWYFLWSTPE